MGLPTDDNSRTTIASATPIVITGNPFDFRSNHIRARTADEVGAWEAKQVNEPSPQSAA